jgi:hypothetical protein
MFAGGKANKRLFGFSRQNLVTQNHAYVVVEDTPILITKPTNFDEYNELSWLHLEELHMLAAMSLCAPDIGWYSLYGGHDPIYISATDVKSTDLRDNKVLNDLLSLASIESGIIMNFEGIDKTRNGYSDYICPPEVLFNAIDINNNSLIKSLHYWLKACMFSQHRPFNEEATALLFFSMEGFLKLFHEELQKKNAGVRVSEVMQYLIQRFDVPEGYEDYAATCHAQRNDYVHPNKSGWNGDFQADHMLETFNVLKDITYIYLTRNMSITSQL